MRSTGTSHGSAPEHESHRLARRRKRSKAVRRPAMPGWLAGAAVAALALAASLLATATPAGAASMAGAASLTAAAPQLGKPLGGAGVQGEYSPVVWNGTDLVTAQIDLGGNLSAYEQVPGAATWQAQSVETAAAAGATSMGFPSITATATSVQIISHDTNGNIWFFQQIDGQTTWSAPQLVANIPPGDPESETAPQIAWTGVPGHAGTNSVIAAESNSGVAFFYQNGGGWTEQTVTTGSATNPYYFPRITATDRGIVIVALGPGSDFYSWYQPYGGSGWKSDGSIGVQPGQWFADTSVTWDGTNVDVAAAFNDGASGPDTIDPDKMMLLWKSDSASSWSDETLPGTSSAQPLASFTPGIAFTGFNLVLSEVQWTSITPSSESLDFWWQGTTFTNFNYQQVTTTAGPNEIAPASIVSTHSASSPGEVVIVAPFTTNHWQTTGLYDWTQPTGGSGWTMHVVTPP